jgi:ribosomal protein S4
LAEELEFLGKYGLRNKREFWKMRTMLGNWRSIARKSRSLSTERAAEVQETLSKKLIRSKIRRCVIAHCRGLIKKTTTNHGL